MQQEKPEDFVIATGVQYSVRQFVELAASESGMHITWKGSGKEEKGYLEDGRCIIAVDEEFFRPAEVETLLGDPTKAKNALGWFPEISFEDMVIEMMTDDLKSARYQTHFSQAE